MLKEKNKGVAGHLKNMFKGFNPDDNATNTPITIGKGIRDNNNLFQSPENKASKFGKDDQLKLTSEFNSRDERMSAYQLMGGADILQTANGIHLAHALSSKGETGDIFDIIAIDDSAESKRVVTEIKADLFAMINEHIMSWANVMCTYGVNYIRPYGTEKKGIHFIEHNYYTLPTHVREYERAGMLAGFSSEYFADEQNNSVRLLEPWKLVSFKIPHWTPNPKFEPIYIGKAQYSLFEDDLMARSAVETQNYGTSFFETTYEPFLDLMEGVQSLKAARRNSSKIDRVLGVNLGNLDPYAATDYYNLVSAQLKKDSKKAQLEQTQRNFIGTVWNTIIPILGDKGSLQIDTQVGDANIQNIEDINFHLKRVASSLAIDPSLLGWQDMAGQAMGEGGFFRTSIQATVRADWIRQASTNMINRLIDIHFSYKYGKAFGNKRPYKIVFNSMNTALEIEEQENRSMRVDFATGIATMLDTFAQSALGKSKAAYEYALIDIVKMPKEQADLIITDLVAKVEQNEDMMESLGDKTDPSDIKTAIIEVLTEITNEAD